MKWPWTELNKRLDNLANILESYLHVHQAASDGLIAAKDTLLSTTNAMIAIEGKMPLEAKIIETIAERETALLTRVTNLENSLQQLIGWMSRMGQHLDGILGDLSQERLAKRPVKPARKRTKSSRSKAGAVPAVSGRRSQPLREKP